MALHDDHCLALYERGLARHPIDRALLLAATADERRDWADAPLGERDAQLIALRCDWFGPRFDAVQPCPDCKQLLDLSLNLQALAGTAGPKGRDDLVRVSGARFRLPTSRDLAAVSTQRDVDGAAQALLRRLAMDGEPDGGWSDDDIAAIEQALDDADPLAHVTVAAVCEACGHRWQAALDIGASTWEELAAQARDTVQQVHLLAGAYGWSERQILSMSAARRELYLQQVVS